MLPHGLGLIRTLPLLLLFPGALSAQGGLSITPYLGVDGGIDGGRVMSGLTVTRYVGPLGVRAGGAMDFGTSPLTSWASDPGADAGRAWAGDVDALLAPTRVPGLNGVFGDLDPTLFFGIGFHGARGADGSSATIGTWSYGLGAGKPLLGWLSVDGELRYRSPHRDAAALPPHVGGGLEGRLGLAVNLGGHPASSRTRGPPTHAPDPTAARSPSPMRGPVRDAVVASSASADALVMGTLFSAELHLGTRYRWGGATPQSGFDCSGFVQYVYAANGVSLPRTSRQQAAMGSPVPTRLDAFRPGDLLVFASNGRTVDHVAIYAGEGRIIHSSQSGGGVRYDDLRSPRGRWYIDHMVDARRVIQAR